MVSHAAPRLRPGRKRVSVSAILNGSSEASWDQLDHDAGGRLDQGALAARRLRRGTPDASCEQLFKELENPYFLGDEVGLTQSLGWVGGWTSEPSVYAAAAKTTRMLLPRSISRGRTICGLW